MKNFKITSAALMLAVVLSSGKCGKDQAEKTDSTTEVTTEPDITTSENQEVTAAEEGEKVEKATPTHEKAKEVTAKDAKEKEANTTENEQKK